MIFEILAFGHPNITAKHRTTFEVTKDPEISKRADCVIGVMANKSIAEIPEELKEILKSGAKIEVELSLPDYGIKDKIFGFGDPKLSFKHDKDIVIRKSRFICGRTLLISADKSALDLNREMIELLKDKKTELMLLLKVESEVSDC
ncbi:MAG: DUF371 domain-containing protein [Archaeoglobaceae archaeon]|nr:DUF371 domain-containing protein [Archaeoglobaceae archaeon]MDW8118255.1 DUF371 domain-containing protein [Archaeoglobaceae archaeon]